MDLRRIVVPRWLVAIIDPQRRGEAALRIGEEGRDARERLVLLGVEDMEDRADEQRVAGLLPMVAPLERAFGVDQDVGDVLDVADLVRRRGELRAADCSAPSAASVGLNSRQCEKRERQPAVSCQFSPLMSWMTAEPVQRQQGRNDQADALAAARRREGHDMLGAVVAEIVGRRAAEEDARVAEQPGARDLASRRPARRAVGGDVAPTGARARASRRSAAPQPRKPLAAGERAGPVEHLRRIGLVMIPPAEQRPGPVERQLAEAWNQGRPSSGW